jgi:hypothetical protein
MNLLDFGDAMVETKQLAPGTRPDSVFQFGLKVGSHEEGLENGRLLASPPQPEASADECAGASECTGDF